MSGVGAGVSVVVVEGVCSDRGGVCFVVGGVRRCWGTDYSAEKQVVTGWEGGGERGREREREREGEREGERERGKERE